MSGRLDRVLDVLSVRCHGYAARRLRGSSDERIERWMRHRGIQRVVLGAAVRAAADGSQARTPRPVAAVAVCHLSYRCREASAASWLIEVCDGRARLFRPGARAAPRADLPRVTLTVGIASFLRLLIGELDSIALFRSPGVVVDGNLITANRVARALGR